MTTDTKEGCPGGEFAFCDDGWAFSDDLFLSVAPEEEDRASGSEAFFNDEKANASAVAKEST